MYGGVALYLLGHVAFRYRIWHHVSWQRLVAVVILLALIPLAERMPALAALGLLAAVMVGLIAYETVTKAEYRERVRHEEEPIEVRPAT